MRYTHYILTYLTIYEIYSCTKGMSVFEIKKFCGYLQHKKLKGHVKFGSISVIKVMVLKVLLTSLRYNQVAGPFKMNLNHNSDPIALQLETNKKKKKIQVACSEHLNSLAFGR